VTYLQIHKAKVALNFPTFRAGAGSTDLAVGTCFSPLLGSRNSAECSNAHGSRLRSDFLWPFAHPLGTLRLRAFVTISRDKAQQGTAGLQKFKKREGRVAEMKGKKGKKLVASFGRKLATNQ
jgi:hypothetical protein